MRYEQLTINQATVRQILFDQEYDYEQGSAYPLISIGTYAASGEELRQSQGEFIRKADEALYKAKGLGRNRIVAYKDLFPPRD